MKKIYLLSLLSIFSLNLFCQIDWTKHPDNPVMVPGSAGEWDEHLDGIGSVIFYKNLYHMWYRGFNNSGGSIGHATSPDGIIWTKDPNNPVFEKGPSGSWDQDAIFCGDVTHINDTLHMWYTGFKGDWLNASIGHATSEDGIKWIRDANNPVLTKGAAGSWEDAFVWIDEVILVGSEYHMWYAGYGQGGQGVGHATSPDGLLWVKDTLNPVLEPGMSEEWDNPNVCFPAVLFDGITFHMWYTGGDMANGQIHDIGYATSPDGTIWTKYAGNPVLKKGAEGSWDSRSVWIPHVIDSAGIKYKMWYMGGTEYENDKFGYAESYSPAWKQMKSMDIARGGQNSCVFDSMIYVFGGTDASVDNTLDSADAFNTEANEWTDLAKMLEDIYGCNTEVVKNKIYLAGGWRNIGVSNWITTNSTVEYDPEENTWQEKTGSPEKNGGGASCVLNDTIYILGGTSGYDPLDSKKAWYYAPGTDSWGTLPDMIYDRPGGSSAIIDNKIYVIGGTYGSGWNNPTGKSEVYDLKSKTWTELPDMPVPVIYHISVVHNQKIVVFGGDSSRTPEGLYGTSIGTNFIQEYDPATDSWKLMEGMPFKRSRMAGEKVGNYVYLIGGYLNGRDLDEPLSEVWRFNLDSLNAYDPSGGIEKLAELSVVDPVSIYPNPFNTNLTIEIKNNMPVNKIEILSLDGRLVRILDNIQVNSITINRENLPSGLYFLRIHADEVYLKKVMVH